MTYVNLKDLAEFNKYTTGLGAGCFVYIDKLEGSPQYARTFGIVLAAIVVALGVIVMSVKGRISGDDINYATEPDKAKQTLFKVVSRTLSVQMAALLITIAWAGYLSLARIWHWH